MDLDIDQLPARLKALEQNGFRDFAIIFGPRLRAYFLVLGSNPADAEALAVSCITDISLKAERFEDRGPGSFEKWAFRLAKNAWVDEYRIRRHYRVPDGTVETFVDRSSFEDFEEPQDCQEPRSGVSEAIAMLSETDRAIISAHYLEGELTFTEIGQVLGMSEGAVRTAHHRAIKRLRMLLEEHESRLEPGTACAGNDDLKGD